MKTIWVMQQGIIYVLLGKLAENHISDSELTDFIKFSAGLSMKFLKAYHLGNLYKMSYAFEDLNSLSVQAVTPLFVKNPSVKEFPLLTSLRKLGEVKNQDDALFYFHKLIGKRTNQFVHNLLKEYDPFYKRTSQNLSYHIKINKLKKRTIFGKVYIVDAKKIVHYNKPFIQFEELRNLVSSRYELASSKYLDYLFKEIEIMNLFPAIPYNDLILALKETKIQDFSDFNLNINIDQNYENEEIIEISYKYVQKHLEWYVEKGKLDASETVIFKNAFINIIEDIKSGKIKRGIYSYLELDDKGNDNKYYYSILDYLLRVFKKKLHKSLSEK